MNVKKEIEQITVEHKKRFAWAKSYNQNSKNKEAQLYAKKIDVDNLEYQTLKLENMNLKNAICKKTKKKTEKEKRNVESRKHNTKNEKLQ